MPVPEPEKLSLEHKAVLLVVIGYRRKGGASKARVEEILMLEAKLEMLETQVIPKTAEEMRAKLTRKGIT